MYNPGVPLPPELGKHEREYRNERRRSGSSADPFTAIVSLLIIFGVLILRVLRLPFKMVFSRTAPEATITPQESEPKGSENWKSRS